MTSIERPEVAIVGGAYAKDVVHDQLKPQKIFFPEKGEELPAKLNQYAGEQVDNGDEARAFADDYIGLHLEGIGQGRSYSEVSGEFMKNPEDKELAQQRQTLFMGETLRGVLLNAWGWSTVGNVATMAGIALIIIGAILLLIPLLALRSNKRTGAAPAA